MTDSSRVFDLLEFINLTTFLTTGEIGASAAQAIPSQIITKSSWTAGEHVGGKTERKKVRLDEPQRSGGTE